MKRELPLGMNARNFLYIIPYNKQRAKKRADNKLATKLMLVKNKISTPDLLAQFVSAKDIENFDWMSLPKTFVLKPAHGYAGSGIRLVKSWDGVEGRDEKGEVITQDELIAHVYHIITGIYSLNSYRDQAFIEQRIVPMHFFRKIPIVGIPDIRVIVFSGVPVMAMIRIATIDSNGTANLTQGAVGVGIDISTGITTYGWQKGKTIRLFPGTKIKLRGIKIPEWEDVLEQAVMAQKHSKLGFAGIDIILDKKKGPVVVEINARPGLSIQSVNQSSLHERMKRVRNISPKPDVARGVEIGKQLFTEDFSYKVPKEVRDDVVGIFEKITIRNDSNGKQLEVVAKMDTGAYRTSIDSEIAEKLGFETGDRVVKVRSSTGAEERETAEAVLIIKNKKVTTLVSVTDRAHMRYPVIIGRNSLRNFLVDPSLNIHNVPSKEDTQ